MLGFVNNNCQNQLINNSKASIMAHSRSPSFEKNRNAAVAMISISSVPILGSLIPTSLPNMPDRNGILPRFNEDAWWASADTGKSDCGSIDSSIIWGGASIKAVPS